MEKVHVMLDLETFGRKPGSVIASIGAVKFDGQRVLSLFERNIDVVTCEQAGLSMDAETVIWWLQQSLEARKELLVDPRPLTEVLEDFATWLNAANMPAGEIWGNGVAFDNAILLEAYDRVGMPKPWPYWADRCYRTLKARHPEIGLERSGLHHRALDDARSQAVHLMRIWREMGR